MALNHVLSEQEKQQRWRWRAAFEDPHMELAAPESWSEVEEALFLHFPQNWFHHGDADRLIDGKTWHGKQYWKWIGLGREDLAQRLSQLVLGSPLGDHKACALAALVASLGALRLSGCLLLLLPSCELRRCAALVSRLFEQTQLCAAGPNQVFLVGLRFQGLHPNLLKELNAAISKDFAGHATLDAWVADAGRQLPGNSAWRRLPEDLPRISAMPLQRHLLWGKCREHLLQELAQGDASRPAKRRRLEDLGWWQLDRTCPDHRAMAQCLEGGAALSSNWQEIRLPPSMLQHTAFADSTPAANLPAQQLQPERPPAVLVALVRLLKKWLPERLAEGGLSYQRCLCIPGSASHWLSTEMLVPAVALVPEDPGAAVPQGQQLVLLELCPGDELSPTWRRDTAAAVSVALRALAPGGDLFLELPGLLSRFTAHVAALLACCFTRVAAEGRWLMCHSLAAEAGAQGAAVMTALWAKLAALPPGHSVKQVLPARLLGRDSSFRRYLTDFNNAMINAKSHGEPPHNATEAGFLRELTQQGIKRHLFVGEKHRALVGLYFGTFDPLHENHFRLVLCALRKCGARRVVLVPNQGGNPYKPSCSSLAARIAAIQERIAAAESCGDLSPGEVVVREEAGANNWPQREKVAQAVEREEFADTEASAVVALLLGEDSFRKSLSQAEGKHKNTGIFQLQNKPRRLIVFPRENRPGLSLVPEKLSARVEVAPYRDLVEGLSSSQIRQLLHSGEAPDEAAVHPVVWARFKAHASREVGAVTQDSPEWSDEEMEEDAGQGWKDPESHYDAQAPQSRARRLQSPTVRLRNCNSLAKAVLLEQFLSAVSREAGDDHPPLSVLDLGCGKGGDLKKLVNSGATNYCGVDVSKASLEVLVSRVQDLQSILPAARHGLLATSREPLREVSLIHADCWHTRLEHQWDTARHGTARSPSGQCWFHLVSSQMACHYAFGTQESVEIMLENAASRLCAGGYFVGTVPDAARIIESKGKGSGELLGVTFTAEEWSKVEAAPELWRQSSDAGLAVDPRAFGVMYTFRLVDAVDDCREPLVHMPSMVAMARRQGLQLRLLTPLYQLAQGDKAALGRLRRIYAFSGGMALESEAPEMQDAMKFYLAFAFQKEAGETPSCREISESLRELNGGTPPRQGEILSLRTADCDPKNRPDGVGHSS
ncbi:unnamed protein product [Effrenium voratum]|uniref:mRNA (guanine-N(7))-methyltransferase n=1 Tax=Effrenium voratum TaxID=2562239 RepID=A0AA36ISL4_9DINO|nr:unnamed protein product [Effrenium voratum]